MPGSILSLSGMQSPSRQHLVSLCSGVMIISVTCVNKRCSRASHFLRSSSTARRHSSSLSLRRASIFSSSSACWSLQSPLVSLPSRTAPVFCPPLPLQFCWWSPLPLGVAEPVTSVLPPLPRHLQGLLYQVDCLSTWHFQLAISDSPHPVASLLII